MIEIGRNNYSMIENNFYSLYNISTCGFYTKKKQFRLYMQLALLVFNLYYNLEFERSIFKSEFIRFSRYLKKMVRI